MQRALQPPLAWIILPAVDTAFVLIRAQVSDSMSAGFSGPSRYPYPFVDVDLYGLGMVLLMVSAILLAFLVLGFLLFGLDRLMGKMEEGR